MKRPTVPDVRLRILMVVPYDLSEPGGGVKHHALGLARVLRDRGDIVVVAGPTSQPVREPNMVGFRGVTDVQFNGSANRIGIFVNPRSVRRFLRQNQFDVIHVHDPLVPALPYWMAWLSGQVPKVCTFHAFAEQPTLGQRLGHRLTAPWLLPRYKRAMAVSLPAQQFVRRIWRRPLSIVPNGVHTDVFTPGPDFDLARRVDTDHPLRLFFCARLSDERKGFADLVSAYTLLRERRIPVTLDVAGEAAGPVPPDLPGLTYHGPVSRATLVKRFQACDVVVAPSTGQESFGIILLEAMATGRAIVCSDIDGYRQAVDAQGAYLVPRRSPESLVAAIADLVRDPERRRTMAVANRSRALQFDWTRLTSHVRAQYLMAMDDQPEAALQLAPALATSPALPATSAASAASAYVATAQ
jgi:phosphatidylinositol alpha-mannosyltransferase